jgi:hypothetical protein
MHGLSEPLQKQKAELLKCLDQPNYTDVGGLQFYNLTTEMTAHELHAIFTDNNAEIFYKACQSGHCKIIDVMLKIEKAYKEVIKCPQDMVETGKYRAVIDAVQSKHFDVLYKLVEWLPQHQFGILEAMLNWIPISLEDSIEKVKSLKILLPILENSKDIYIEHLSKKKLAKSFPHKAEIITGPKQENSVRAQDNNGVRKGVNIALGCITLFSAFMTGISRYYNLSSSTVISTSAYITMGSLVTAWFSNEKAHLIKKVQDNPGHKLLPGERNIIKYGRAIENIWQSRASQSLLALCEFVGKSIIDATGICIASVKKLCNTASDPAESTQAVIDHKLATVPSHDHKHEGFGRELF